MNSPLEREVSAPASWQSKREQLIEGGYCICEGVLSAEMLERVRAASDQL